MEPFYALARRCQHLPDLVLEILNSYRAMASPGVSKARRGSPTHSPTHPPTHPPIHPIHLFKHLFTHLPIQQALAGDAPRTADVWTLIICAHAALGDLRLSARVFEDAVKDGQNRLQLEKEEKGSSWRLGRVLVRPFSSFLPSSSSSPSILL